MEQSEGISIPLKRQYNLAQRLFCVPALRTCTHTDGGLELTKQQRHMRKKMMLTKQLSSQFSIDEYEAPNRLVELSTIGILQQLYTNENYEHRNLIFSALKTKRLNPILKHNAQRHDLQYYIPQLITYLAFQQDLCDYELIQFIIRCCQIHFVFSHYCYFYLNSIKSVNNIDIQAVNQFLQGTFLPAMQIYKDHTLTELQIIKKDKNIKVHTLQPSQIEIQTYQKYGTIEQDQIKLKFVENIKLSSYSQDGYLSTPRFWQQLINIGNNLYKSTPKIVGLRKELRQINKKLPASVYIPFLKYRNYVIVNINIETAKVFSTKERAPYSICLEVIKEQEEYVKDQIQRKVWAKKISKEMTVANNQNILKLQIQSKSMRDDEFRHSVSKTKTLIQMSKKQHLLQGIRFLDDIDIKQPQSSHQNQEEQEQKDIEKKIQFHKLITKQSQQKQQQQEQCDMDSQLDRTSVHTQTSQNQEEQNHVDKYFDIPFDQIESKYKEKSIYKHFKSWKMVNIMIKTGDNLKQQQFAIQMINQFHIIFEKEKTQLLLRPYQVMSITPDSGIMEMVTDTCSLGRVIKIMKKQKISSLKEFFKTYFGSRYKEAQKNFCRSLAAYSLVTYFLQIKDRHNQNILLHRDGQIVHIDFGFFLSNSPGKGIQLQKKVPFKLMSSYVDILGGQNSSFFSQYRRLFENGFKAAMKHKQSLLLLVKMMYSSHGQSMPCFQAGTACIQQMTKRFEPNTQNISQHCQNLINQSLDNWRAKWYDKFQYWFQGIFY